LDASVVLFLGLLGTVGVLRGVELAISRRRQRDLRSKGVQQAGETHFLSMVLLHVGVLLGAAVEIVALDRPFIPALGASMLVVWLLANGLRWWVIHTLGPHWNVRVMDSLSLGVVTGGPFRLIRHPNYVAVFLELLALPLVHTAWLTAIVGSLVHVWVISERLAVEEAVLVRNPTYRATMAFKPRFVPTLRSLAPRARLR
jgi:methyltransferase